MVNHVKTVTTAEIKRRVKEKHGSTIIVFSEFEGWKHKMSFKCAECKGIWQTKPQNVCDGSRCPTCGRKKSGAAISKGKAASVKTEQRIEANTVALRAQLRRQKVLWVEGTPRFSRATSNGKVKQVQGGPKTLENADQELRCEVAHAEHHETAHAESQRRIPAD